MALRRFIVPVTVDDQGDGTAYTPPISGKIISFTYIKTDYTGDDLAFVITAETSGETLWSEEDVTASATRHPRVATQTVAGAAALRAADTGEAVLDYITIGRDRVKIVVAAAGDTTTGTFHVTIDG